MEDSEGEIADKVVKYEEFVNNRLKDDLRKVLMQQDKIYDQIEEYMQLKTVIDRLKDEGLEKMTTQVDLGCNFYCKAKVDDASKIFVSIGYGFFIELTYQEALNFIEKKTKHLNNKCDELSKDAARIKAHIKIVLEGLKELQGLQVVHPSPYRDVLS